MELTELAKAASTAVLWGLDKAAEGALQQIGVKIFEFLKRRFQGQLQSEKVKKDTNLLEAFIISEAHKDNKFKESLEQLVIQFQQVQQQSNAKVSQNTAEGVNINADRNQGVVIGQQNTNFRQ